MNDEQPPESGTSPDLDPAPAAPDESATTAETVQAPTPDTTPTEPRNRRTRELLVAGAAGLVVAGGLAGFGIGRATAGDDGDGDGPRFARTGQVFPGQQGRGHDGQRPRQRGKLGDGGKRMGPPGGGPGNVPGGQPGNQSNDQSGDPAPAGGDSGDDDPA